MENAYKAFLLRVILIYPFSLFFNLNGVFSHIIRRYNITASHRLLEFNDDIFVYRRKGDAVFWGRKNVVVLASVAAPFPLNAGCLRSLFGMAGIVNLSDSLRMVVVFCGTPLNVITKQLFIPVHIRDESSQRYRRRFDHQCDGFDALSL